MSLRRLLVLLVLVCQWSCDSSSESPVRGNVHEILRGGLWEDARCTEQHFEYCCLGQGLTSCTGFDNTSIVAVRHRGDRVGVLLLSNGVHLILLQTEDRGTTWTTVSIEDDDFGRGGSYYTGGLDLLLTADATWLYAPHGEIGAGGGTYSRGYFFRIDMTTGKLTTDLMAMPGAPPVEERDGRAIFIVPEGDPFSGEISLLTHEIDPANRANDRSFLVPCNEPCSGLSSTAFLGTDDGELYVGVTRNVAPRAECTITYHRTTQTVTKLCVPHAEWPGTGEAVSVLPFAGKQGALVKAFSRGGHAWAATMIDDGNETGHSSEPVDLGPGTIFPNGSFGGWPRFRGMAIVQGLGEDGVTPGNNLNTRLVRVPASGLAQNVELPTTPCEDDSKCGYLEERQPEIVGQTHWIESLGNDDHLVFYRSDRAEGIAAHQLSISVALEHATYKNIEGTTLPLDGAVGYENAAEMAAIGAMCARATSCVYGAPDALLVCMLYWSVQTVLLTNHHVASSIGAVVGRGCLCDCWCCECCDIGRLIDAQLTNRVDGSIATLNPGVRFSHEILGIGAIRGSGVATVGMPIVKWGQTSGLTHGTVTQDNLPPFTRTDGATFVGQIRVAPTAPDITMSDGGDSGSVYVDANTLRIVGLNHAGSEGPGPGIGNHIADVMTLLKISFPVMGTAGAVPLTAAADAAQPTLLDSVAALQRDLERTPIGQEWLALIRLHATEVRYLVNHHRPTKIAWQRSHGPGFLAHFLKSARDRGHQVPREIGGMRVENVILAMARVLHQYGSEALTKAIGDYYLDVLQCAQRARSAEDAMANAKRLAETQIPVSKRGRTVHGRRT